MWNPSALHIIETISGPLIATILFILPMYAVRAVPAMRKYRAASNVFVLVMGLIALSALIYGRCDPQGAPLSGAPRHPALHIPLQLIARQRGATFDNASHSHYYSLVELFTKELFVHRRITLSALVCAAALPPRRWPLPIR